MRVLVTGGAGYIGSHTCKALAAAGHKPVVYDNLSTGHRWAVKWGPFEHGDVADHPRVSEVLARHRPDAVMHFAASAYVGESVARPDKYYRNNVGGTLQLLDAMRRHGVDKFIFSSSCATYGVPERVPITERSSQEPISPYGRSKLMVEQILRDYAAAFDLHSIALRYFNAAGADPDGELGEEHDPETHVIPLVLRAAAGLEQGVTIFGEDYDTEDGTCIRDYAHVSDLASAHLLALGQVSGRSGFSAYNLGSGSGLSVRAIIDAAHAITGRPIAVKTGPRRTGDPPILMADPNKAFTDLGWRCRHSSAEAMIGSAWSWMNRTMGSYG